MQATNKFVLVLESPTRISIIIEIFFCDFFWIGVGKIVFLRKFLNFRVLDEGFGAHKKSRYTPES